MGFSDYEKYDAVGLAELVARALDGCTDKLKDALAFRSHNRAFHHIAFDRCLDTRFAVIRDG